jgi:GDPmannose 4,6-dehydratase
LKKAVVAGCNGQDGSYLVEQLSGKGYAVLGIGRGVVTGPLGDGRPIDIEDSAQVRNAIAAIAPDEVYFLAACHHSSEGAPGGHDDLVRCSFEIDTLALNHFLQAIAEECPRTRLFYAASSHVFGDPESDVQDENTPFRPVDPYGISKAAGVQLCRYYRNRRKVRCGAGILYNHESPRRPSAFVSQKVVQAAVRISRRTQHTLVLGDLDAKVDWGYAPDYVDAMWRMLQLDEPEDFVISSGAMHSVRELVETAFGFVGLDWAAHVEVRPEISTRPSAGVLRGCSARLEAKTDWRPSMSFRDMIRGMVEAETCKPR